MYHSLPFLLCYGKKYIVIWFLLCAYYILLGTYIKLIYIFVFIYYPSPLQFCLMSKQVYCNLYILIIITSVLWKRKKKWYNSFYINFKFSALFYISEYNEKEKTAYFKISDYKTYTLIFMNLKFLFYYFNDMIQLFMKWVILILL